MKYAALVIFSVLTLNAVPAVAQHQSNHSYDGLKVGTVRVFQRSPRGNFESRFLGKRSGLYVFEIYSTNGSDKEYDRTIYRNSKGQTVRMERSDGATIKYEPHNCWLVVGECIYVVYDRNGIPGTYRAIGKAAKRGFTQKTDYLNGSKYESFSKIRIKFDEEGRETSRQIQQNGTRTRIELKRVVLP